MPKLDLKHGDIIQIREGSGWGSLSLEELWIVDHVRRMEYVTVYRLKSFKTGEIASDGTTKLADFNTMGHDYWSLDPEDVIPQPFLTAARKAINEAEQVPVIEPAPSE